MAGYPANETAADQQPAEHGDERARYDPAQDQPGGVRDKPGKNKDGRHKVNHQHPLLPVTESRPALWRPVRQQRVQARVV
jgi:hypothetical protein